MTDPTPSVLSLAREAAPDLEWRPGGAYGEAVQAYAVLPDGRFLNVERERYGRRAGALIVDVWRILRETPTPDGKIETLRAAREHLAEDLAAAIAEAMADELPAVVVAGLRLWPSRSSGSGENGWRSDCGRYVFEPFFQGGWVWRCETPASEKAAILLQAGNRGLGGTSESLAEAVADALDAPRRLAAALTLLNEELTDTRPLDPYTYAGVLVARDGERQTFTAPALYTLKETMRAAQGSFIGRMDTDASHIAAVPLDQAEGLDAEALLTHPAALRIDRY